MPYMGAIGFLAAKHGGNVHHQKCNCSIPIKVVKSEGDGNVRLIVFRFVLILGDFA